MRYLLLENIEINKSTQIVINQLFFIQDDGPMIEGFSMIWV